MARVLGGVPHIPRTMPAVRGFNDFSSPLNRVDLANANLSLGSPVLSVTPAFAIGGTAWAGSALLTPLATWTTNENQYFVAALNAAIATSLSANALTYIFDLSESLVVASAFTIPSIQKVVAAEANAPVSALSATAGQLDVSTAALSAAASLNVNALTYIFDLSETLAAASAFSTASIQQMAGVKNLAPVPALAAIATQINLASASFVNTTVLGANALTYIFDLSELLVPSTSWLTTTIQREALVTALNPISVLGAQAVVNKNLTATSIASTAAAFDTPLLATTYGFTANTLACGADGIGTSAFSQVSILSASSLVCGADSLGQPVYGNVFIATTLASAAAGIGAPLLSTVYSFTAANLACGAAGIGAPVAHQANVLGTPAGLASAAAAIGTPAFNQGDVFTATVLASAADGLGQPLLATNYSFSAVSIASAAAGFANSKPVIAIVNVLSASTLAAAAAFIGIPALTTKYSFVSNTLASSADAIGAADYAGCSNFTSSTLACGADAIGTAALHPTSVLSASPIASTAAQLTTPIMLSTCVFNAVTLATHAAAIGHPVYSTFGELIPVAITTASPVVVAQPVLGLIFPLLAQSTATNAIFVGRPVLFENNRNNLPNTLRRLEGLTAQGAAQSDLRRYVMKPPFTPTQLRKMKGFTDSYLRNLNKFGD